MSLTILFMWKKSTRIKKLVHVLRRKKRRVPVIDGKQVWIQQLTFPRIRYFS